MTEHPPLKTVADLKLPRYLGTWYEIARLPMRHEPEGCTDVSAHYTLLDNGNVGVTNRCRMDGEIEEATGEACAVDNDSARLEVSFLPKGLRWLPFAKGDYWVIQSPRTTASRWSAARIASTCGCWRASHAWTRPCRTIIWPRPACRASICPN